MRHHTFCGLLQHVILSLRSLQYFKGSGILSWTFFQGHLAFNLNGCKQRIRGRGKNRLHGSLKAVDDQHGICLVLAALFSEP